MEGVSFAIGGTDLGVVFLDDIGYERGNDEAVGEWIWNGERVILWCKGIVYLPSHAWVLTLVPLIWWLKYIALGGIWLRLEPFTGVVVFFTFVPVSFDALFFSLTEVLKGSFLCSLLTVHLLVSLDEGVFSSRGRGGVERLRYDGGGEDEGDGREGR